MHHAQPLDVILRTPWGGPWRRFSRPVRIIEARALSDVRKALRAVDEAVRGGSYAAGFVTYEAAGAFGLPVRDADPALPLLVFGIYPPDRVEALRKLPAAGDATIGAWGSTVDRAAYLSAIHAIKARIEAGDTYQINFTFRLESEFSGDPLAVMRDLHAAQAGPWSAYVDGGDYAICSASPELFFRVEGERVRCRPMKGTSPRGYWPEQDEARAAALRESEKNRAENVMIVDMARNDLGRIARVGAVHPVSLFDVERYPLQWQLTSTVDAEVNQPTLARVFAAMFPCGSITGAPKHSSMSIIRELESTPRGIYTGAIGCITPGGRSHFNVAIRTVVIDRSAGRASFGVGSGVVWDSVDQDEYEECLLKADILGTRSSGPAYVIGDSPSFRLLETLAWTPGEGFVLLDAHLSRLQASAACFGFACELEEARALLAGAVEDLRGPAKLRLMLQADGTLLCEAIDINILPDPLRVSLATAPVDRGSVFLYHKTTNREVYERARASRPDADAVILWNADGEVTEATESNVVILRDGVKVTPPVECGLLPGLKRAELLASGDIVEGRISTEEFLGAEHIWLVNSVRGWIRAEIADT